MPGGRLPRGMLAGDGEPVEPAHHAGRGGGSSCRPGDKPRSIAQPPCVPKAVRLGSPA
jgi:hypothetical protein